MRNLVFCPTCENPGSTLLLAIITFVAQAVVASNSMLPFQW